MNRTEQNILKKNKQVHIYNDGTVQFQSPQSGGHPGADGGWQDLPFNVKEQTRNGQDGYLLQGEFGDNLTAWIPDNSLLDVVTFIGRLYQNIETVQADRTRT